MSIYEVVCDYVYDKVFAKNNEFNKVAKATIQGLCVTQAMAETMSMEKMPAANRNDTYYKKRLARGNGCSCMKILW